MRDRCPVFHFARNVLDLNRYELRRSGHRLHLSRLPMELLILLVRRRGDLVTREDAVTHLWPDPLAVDTTQGLNSAIARIRAFLGDNPSKPRFIETVIGCGYRFVADVREEESAAALRRTAS